MIESGYFISITYLIFIWRLSIIYSIFFGASLLKPMSRIIEVRSQWVEGSNEIWLIEKGVEMTIRFNIDGGKIRMADAFSDFSEKIIGNLILY